MKEHGSGWLVLSASESSISDKFIKKKFAIEYLMHLDVVDFKRNKRAEEKAKENQRVKEKNNEDYAWKDLCENPTKLKSSKCQS